MAGDDFTRRRMMWLESIADHPAISATGFRVAFNISRRFNRERFNEAACLEAWPSQAEIAAQSGITRRGAQKCIEALSAHGLLSVIAGRGRGNRSTCRAVIHELEKANAHSPFIDGKGEPSFAFNPDEKANRETKKANGKTKKGEPPFAHKSLSQISDKISEQETLSSPVQNSSDDGFDRFWSTYPKHVAKSPALKAWRAALKAGASPDQIIDGARRYASERAAEPDPAKRFKFSSHPATWLNGRRWQDAPAPVSTTASASGQRRNTRADSDIFELCGVDFEAMQREAGLL